MKCEFCEKTFSSKTNLLRHQRTVIACIKLQGKIPQGNICDYCKRSYTEKSSLNRHLLNCKAKRSAEIEQNITTAKIKCETEHKEYIKAQKEKYLNKISLLKETNKTIQDELDECKAKNKKLKMLVKEKDEEITDLKVKYEEGKKDVYREVCSKVLDKSTVTNNTAYIHPKLVNIPITNIQPLTEDYVKDRVDNGGYTFDHYLKGENGLVDFIYSITMRENDNGAIERNYVCTDPSRDSYHRLVETKDWQKDKGGKFVDIILDTLSDRVNDYHHKMLNERTSNVERKSAVGYDPDYIYKLNTDMHSGVVQSRGKARRSLRQKIKKETSRKISV